MSAYKVAVVGASSRMGKMLVEAIINSEDTTLVGAIDTPQSPALGTDPAAFLGKTSGVKITADLAEGLANADFLIDFTRPEGTLNHLAYCAEHGINMVIGTTGFDQAGKDAIAEAAKKSVLFLRLT